MECDAQKEQIAELNQKVDWLMERLCLLKKKQETVWHIREQSWIASLCTVRNRGGRTQGLKLSRQTMPNWVLRTAEDHLLPVYEELHQQLARRERQYPVVRQVKTETMSGYEIGGYLEAAKELGYLPIFRLAIEQRLRQRELIALKWGDLNIEACTLTVHEKRTVECGKLMEYGSKTHTIDLPQFTVEQPIQEHKKYPNSETMFANPGARKPYLLEMIRLLHKRVLEQAGWNISASKISGTPVRFGLWKLGKTRENYPPC